MDRDLVRTAYFDEDGFLHVDAAPGYDLLATYFSSDLWGVEAGPYGEVREAALRGLSGEATDEIVSDGFAVEVAGGLTTLSLLSRPEVDLRVSTQGFLMALDRYAAAVTKRHLPADD